VKRIADGIYDDGDGGLHLAVDELLKAHGYADTPENRATLAAMAQRMAEEQFGIPTTMTTDPIQTED
jgi:hypothetical protein